MQRRLILAFKLSPCYNVTFFLLGDSPAPEFYIPTFRNTLFQLHRRFKQELMEQTGCPETSAYKIQTQGNHPKERIQQEPV
jgi:hypothetical protein